MRDSTQMRHARGTDNFRALRYQLGDLAKPEPASRCAMSFSDDGEPSSSPDAVSQSPPLFQSLSTPISCCTARTAGSLLFPSSDKTGSSSLSHNDPLSGEIPNPSPRAERSSSLRSRAANAAPAQLRSRTTMQFGLPPSRNREPLKRASNRRASYR